MYCESQLKAATLALFGCPPGMEISRQKSDPSTYRTAYIHPKDSPSKLLSKAKRGRREQILMSEVERLLGDWIANNNPGDIESTEDREAIVSILAAMVHKKLLQKALCITAIHYGTGADQRVGGANGNLGHGIQTIRPLSVTVPALPEVVHGSAIFARGETQVLCTATLGAPRDGMPMRDPYMPPLATPKSILNDLKNDGTTTTGEKGTSFQDLPVGSLRYLRTQEALASDLNTRKSLADREMTGDSGSLWENRRAFLQYDFPSFSTGELPTAAGMQHNRRAIGTNAISNKSFLLANLSH